MVGMQAGALQANREARLQSIAVGLARELADMMHPHPSIIEGVQECLRMLLNKSIYKPYVFKDRLKCCICENGVCTPIESLV